MKNVFALLLIFILLSFKLSAQNDKIIAKVGPSIIDEFEFKNRFNLNPSPTKLPPGLDDSAKANFLYTLIAEKLYALEGKNLRFELSDEFKYSFKLIEKLYIRDALFKIKIMDNLSIDEKALNEAVRRNSVFNYVRYIHSDDFNEINSIHNLLLSGMDFDSILATRYEYVSQAEPLETSYGSFIEEVEDAVYSLLPEQVSFPVEREEGWYIFKLEDRVPKKYAGADDFQKSITSAKNILTERQIEKFYKSYMKEIFKDKEVESNPLIFENFVWKLYNLFDKYKLEPGRWFNGTLRYTEFDNAIIETQFGEDTLKTPFILFEENPISLKEFLRAFLFFGFETKTVDYNEFYARLYGFTKRFIESELLAREGYKLNLQNEPQTAKWIAIWRDYYLAALYQKHLINEFYLSADSIKRNDLFSEQLINVSEILVDDLETIEKILNLLDGGMNFKDLSIKYSNRNWARERSGESGFVTPEVLGETGKIAASLTPGEYIGPIKQPEGYSLIKLLGRIDSEIPATDNLNASNEKTRVKNLYNLFNKEIMRHTAELADKYGIEINREAMIGTDAKYRQMLVYKNMGFGGRLPAAPLTKYFYEWIQLWRQSQKEPL